MFFGGYDGGYDGGLTVRVALSGANANNSSQAGVSALNSNNAPSNTNANIGRRLRLLQ